MIRKSGGRSDARATVDVINFWCVAILLISAASVAAVVGAAVVAGEFDEPEADANETADVDAGVILSEEAGGTSVTWSDPGEAVALEIRDGDVFVEQLDYVGESVVVERDRFEVVAVYEDGTTLTIETYEAGT